MRVIMRGKQDCWRFVANGECDRHSHAGAWAPDAGQALLVPTQEHGNEGIERVLARALPALVRAAERARKIAMQTGTDLVVQENGKIRHITFADNNEVAEPCAVYKPDTNDN